MQRPKSTSPLELKSVYVQPAYAAVQKDLETELARLRVELKAPAQDPPASLTHYHLRPVKKAPARRPSTVE